MAAALAPTCPNCEASGTRKLDQVSGFGFVDYYRCGSCQHVWTADRDTHEVLRHITMFTGPQARAKLT